jgi:CysZ protein
MYLFWNSADSAVNGLSNKMGIVNWLQQQRSDWLNFLFLMAAIMLRIVLVFFYFSFFKYFILILGSPVFAFLSEKTMSIIRGEEFTVKTKVLFNDIWRGIKLSFRNSFWQIVYLFSLLLLSFIPLVGWIVPMIALFAECFYYGFSMMDYACQRIKLSPASSVHFITHHRGLAIGNGLLFYLMHVIVIVGWILAPAYAVIAATLSLYKVKSI